MEAAISAIAGELINRVISFLIKKYTEKTCIGDKWERLQQLLLRVHAIVEEADGRYITNPKMQKQLKLLVENMYQGYHMLDIFRYQSVTGSRSFSNQSASSIPLKRSRTIAATTQNIATTATDDLQSVLEKLEAAIGNMTEFVVLLGVCERMCRRPYDTYLYTDNFMFGRHVEKQQIISILLQTPAHLGAPMVLPIIGGCRVGKKSLISHACNDERIRSHFSSILYINGDSICRIEHAKFSNGRTLVVVEFVTDVDDDDWAEFYSTVTHTAAIGSKVIIISRVEKIARFGTVKVVHINNLSREEFGYLFKMLAFGSTDEKDYPRLASVANELATLLGGSFIPTNVVADLLRRNLNFQFWLHISRRLQRVVENNLSQYGEHPKCMLDKEHPIDITGLASSYRPAHLRLTPPRVERGDYTPTERNLNRMSLADLMTRCIAIPTDSFMLVSWESRIPPYTKYVQDVVCVKQKHGRTTPSKRKSSI